MKGLIIYYSNTGNTLLACRYLAHNIPDVDFDFCSIINNKKMLLDNYDVVGFATFTDTWDPPRLFINYIKNLENQNQKPAFLLNTYGFFSGKTLRTLSYRVTDKGFLILCGHSLKTPENFPPMIRIGLGGADRPGQNARKRFNEFIMVLAQFMDYIKTPAEIRPGKIKIGIINAILPPPPMNFSQHMMGIKKVDTALCTECGLCEKKCPADAISCNPKPVFDDNRCHYCWACYNICPVKAVYTTKYREKYHYPSPNGALKKKLRMD